MASPWRGVPNRIDRGGKVGTMQRQAIALRELIDQLYAEAGQMSATGLDEEKRDRLTAIRRRIDEIRWSLGLTDA